MSQKLREIRELVVDAIEASKDMSGDFHPVVKELYELPRKLKDFLERTDEA